MKRVDELPAEWSDITAQKSQQALREFDPRGLQRVPHLRSTLTDYGINLDDDDFRMARAELARLIEEKFPTEFRARQWENLRRYHMPDNSFRWLCPQYAPKK